MNNHEPKITDISVNWWHGYGNSPSLNVVVENGSLPKFEDFEYEAISLGENGGTFLLSTNLWPWVKFVMIDHGAENGNPSYHGALGGNYRLSDGSTFKTRTGWSSNSGSVNRNFQKYLQGASHIMEVSVYEEGRVTGWAGYNLSVDYLREHPLFPANVYLVQNLTHTTFGWYNPSISETEVVKPNV